jgi:hypothetical protein
MYGTMNIKFYLGAPERTVENQENLQDNRCHDRDSNQSLPKYKWDSSDTRLYRIYFDRLFTAVMNKQLGYFAKQRDICYNS